jgi:hypothetical protein
MEEEQKPLYEFFVAGVQFHDIKKCLSEIQEGDVLILRSEPHNQYDPNAVAILYPSAVLNEMIMIGYVPAKGRGLSSIVSGLIETTDIICKATSIDPKAKSWEQIKVGIFLQENNEINSKIKEEEQDG